MFEAAEIAPTKNIRYIRMVRLKNIIAVINKIETSQKGQRETDYSLVGETLPWCCSFCFYP